MPTGNTEKLRPRVLLRGTHHVCRSLAILEKCPRQRLDHLVIRVYPLYLIQNNELLAYVLRRLSPGMQQLCFSMASPLVQIGHHPIPPCINLHRIT